MDNFWTLATRGHLIMGLRTFRVEYGDTNPEKLKTAVELEGKQMENVLELIEVGKSKVIEAFNKYTDEYILPSQ